MMSCSSLAGYLPRTTVIMTENSFVQQTEKQWGEPAACLIVSFLFLTAPAQSLFFLRPKCQPCYASHPGFCLRQLSCPLHDAACRSKLEQSHRTLSARLHAYRSMSNTSQRTKIHFAHSIEKLDFNPGSPVTRDLWKER